MTKASSKLRVNGLVRNGPVRISQRDRRLILAMIDAGLRDQQIHAFFSQPGRDFNHNCISALRGADRKLLPPPATQLELQTFFDDWVLRPRLRNPLAAWDLSGTDAALWRVAYRFHPVGQGMLHSGELRQGHRTPFTWVYDCGSVTAQTLVETELDRLCAARGPATSGKPILDLVALSHFDKDHVSGVVHLLGLFQVNLILLPFLPLWQRLWIAAAADELDSDFLRFLVDPTGYLLAAAGDGPTRIVFVPPSDGDPPPAPEGRVGGRPGGEFDDWPMKIRLKTEHFPDVVDGEIAGLTGGQFPAAEFLKAESLLDIDGVWEFVPYNDAHQAKRCPAGFSVSVEPLIVALLVATTENDRQTAFDALKSHYDATFGASGYRRNIISLFLYGGPVQPPSDGCFWSGQFIASEHYCRWQEDQTELAASHFAMLFTGDGSLNSKPRRAAFEKFFLPYSRLGKASVFQVMHHGASGNSSPEVAPLVAPRASIFCSDPSQGERHPDANVLRQFWPYNCIQVDDEIGWGVLGVFEF